MANVKTRFAEPRADDYPPPPPRPPPRPASHVSAGQKHVAKIIVAFKRALAGRGIPYESCSTIVLKFETFLNEDGEDIIFTEFWFLCMVYKHMMWVSSAAAGLDSGSYGSGTVVLSVPLRHRHLPHVLDYCVDVAAQGEIRMTILRVAYDLHSTTVTSIVDSEQVLSYFPARPTAPTARPRGAGSRPRRRRPSDATDPTSGDPGGDDVDDGDGGGGHALQPVVVRYSALGHPTHPPISHV
jgi:hypothetical protein